MKEGTKVTVTAAILTVCLAVIFKNIADNSAKALSIAYIPVALWVGYITGRAGAKVWLIVTILVSIAIAFYASW